MFIDTWWAPPLLARSYHLFRMRVATTSRTRGIDRGCGNRPRDTLTRVWTTIFNSSATSGTITTPWSSYRCSVHQISRVRDMILTSQIIVAGMFTLRTF